MLRVGCWLSIPAPSFQAPHQMQNRYLERHRGGTADTGDKIQEEAANYFFKSSLPIFVVLSFTNSFRRQVKCIKYISITLTCNVGGQRSGGCRYQASIQYISTSNSSNQDTKYNHEAQFTHGTTSQYRICLYWGYKWWRNIRQQRPHLLSYLTVGVLKTFYVCVVFRMCVHAHIHRLCVMLYVSANVTAWDTVTSRE